MAKPVVDRIERELIPQQVPVLRVNAMSKMGREIAGRYGVRGVPTLVVFDGTGEPMLQQVGRLDRAAVLSAIVELGSG